MDPANRDPYETLGVEPTATRAEIKQAYRDLARVWHPDRFASDPRLQQVAEEKLKRINEAYEALRGRGAERPPPDSPRAASPPAPTPRPGPEPTPRSAAPRPGPLARHPVAASLSVAAVAAIVVIVARGGWLGAGESPEPVAPVRLEEPVETFATTDPEPAAEPRRGGGAAVPRAGVDVEAGAVPEAGGTFGLRATPAEVRAAMGPPGRIEGDVWWYGADRVVFEGGRVVGWANPSGGLRIRVEPAGAGDVRTPDFGVEVENETVAPEAPADEAEEEDWWWRW